jgi:hypothetical protein
LEHVPSGIDPRAGKPWEIRARPDPEPSEPARDDPAKPIPRETKLATAALDQTHTRPRNALKTRVAEGRVRGELKRVGAVEIDEHVLGIGGAQFPLTPEEEKSFTLLEPNKIVISHVWAGLESGRATVVSAAHGSGAAFAIRKMLEAAKKPYAFMDITETTSVDEAAGARKPNEKGGLEVLIGPLTSCVKNGGVFVVNGIEKADPHLRASLVALANGDRVFHHPVTHQPIPVDDNFRLVIIGDQSKALPRELITPRNNIVEVRAYDEDEHFQLLTAQGSPGPRGSESTHGCQLGLPADVARILAKFHETLRKNFVPTATEMDQGQKVTLEFGRNFPFGWPLLFKVGRRLAGVRGEIKPQRLLQALYAVYGARLAHNPASHEQFLQLLRELKLGELAKPRVDPPSDRNYVPTASREVARAYLKRALSHGEAALLYAPNQAGMNALIEEAGLEFRQKVTRVPCHAGTDPDALKEMPTFDADGKNLVLRAGRISRALLNGDLLHIDQIDHVSPERQNALVALQNLREITVIEDVRDKSGKLIERRKVTRPVHPKARIVFTATEGAHRSRHAMKPGDRATLTEIHFDRPTIDEMRGFIPKKMKKSMADLIEATARELYNENPDVGVTKIGRFIDFARTTNLLAEVMTPEEAVSRAAFMIFGRPPAESDALKRLDKRAAAAKQAANDSDTRPLYMKLFGIEGKTAAEVQKKITQMQEELGYAIVDSMTPQLDALAIAHLLRRHVFAIGGSSRGKTVLGEIFAYLVDKASIRINISRATEAKELLTSVAPVPDGTGGTKFELVSMRGMKISELEAIGILDEMNLNDEVQMAIKSVLDRGTIIDAEADIEKPIGTAMFYCTGNETDRKTGRLELTPEFMDCMFVVHFGGKTNAEKVKIVTSQCELDPANIQRVVNFYEALEGAVAASRDPSSNTRKFNPVAQISCTERDMLKVARRSRYLIKRDGITDPEEQRRIVGREAYRQLRGVLLDPDDRKHLYDTLIKNHFGADTPLPERPTGWEPFEREIDGKMVKFWRMGAAQIRELEGGPDPSVEALVPKPDKNKVRPPIGEQLEFEEDLALWEEVDDAPGWVVGATGSGKTMCCDDLAVHRNVPVFEDAYHRDISEEQINGKQVIDPKSGNVVFQYGKLPRAMGWRGKDEPRQRGGHYRADEYALYLDREKSNPTTEGREIQIPHKRPPETITRDDWADDFRFLVTTNPRQGMSAAEASRFTILGMPELSDPSIKELAFRDYAAPQFLYDRPDSDKRPIADGKAAIRDLVAPAFARFDGRTTIRKRLNEALEAALGDKEIEEQELPDLKPATLSDDEIRQLADAYHVFKPKGLASSSSALRLLNHIVESSKDARAATILRSIVPLSALSTPVRALSKKGAVVDGRLVLQKDVEKATQVFCTLRGLQKEFGVGRSPLSARLFDTFMDCVLHFRKKYDFGLAVLKAAEYSLLPKLGQQIVEKGKTLERKGVEALLDIVGPVDRSEEEFPEAVFADDGVWFGDLVLKYGDAQRSEPSPTRYPLTERRIKDMAMFAEAVEMGHGRAVVLTDDPNGQNVEMVQECGRWVGRPVSFVSLPPNVDLDLYIEKLRRVRSDQDIEAFEPELQKIARAVKEGHFLVVQGDVPTEKLERLNSLGDGRRSLFLPLTGQSLEQHENFQLIMLRKPAAHNPYSDALENRLLEPPLSTREGAPDISLASRAQDLAEVLVNRTHVSPDAAEKIATFHTVVNELLTQGRFVSGHGIGSILSRKAEELALRLAYLQSHQIRAALVEESETIHKLARNLYGNRFVAEADRQIIDDLLKDLLGTKGGKVNLGSQVSSTAPTLVKYGPYALARDPLPRLDVPGPETLPPETGHIDEILEQMFGAFVHQEVVHLHGDEFVGMRTVETFARMVNTPIEDIIGREDLSEAYLFGGLMLNPDTGQLEQMNGLINEAEEQGRMVVIRHASRLSPEIIARLTERARNVEERSKGFRLVLMTGDRERPLDPGLAAWTTKIRCTPITEKPVLEKILTHTLRAVPGGVFLAEGLLKFADDAARALRDESPESRQDVVFDSAWILEAASEIRRAVVEKGMPLDAAIANVLSLVYLGPVVGRAAETRIKESISELAKSLSVRGELRAEAQIALDVAQKPELEALRTDYEAVEPGLTSELVRVLSQVLPRLLNDGSTRLWDLLTGLIEARILPEAVREVAQLVLNNILSEDEWEKLGPELQRSNEKELEGSFEALLSALELTRKKESNIEAQMLEFMRGARLWDLEDRADIVDRYKRAFGQIAELGIDSARGPAEALDMVRQRFHRVDALGDLERARHAVTQAFELYNAGGSQANLAVAPLFQELTEVWSIISTSLIFKDDQLPRELEKMESILAALDAIHRAEPAQGFSDLWKTLRVVSERLVGIRVAEGASEVHHGIAKWIETTTEDAARLGQEVTKIAALEHAEAQSRHLRRLDEIIRGLADGDGFLLLDPKDLEIEGPGSTKDAELERRAAARAEPLVRELVEAKWDKLTDDIHQLASRAEAPDVADFWKGVDFSKMDVGLDVEPQSIPKSELEIAFEKATRELDEFREQTLERENARIFKEMKTAAQQEALSTLKERVQRKAKLYQATVQKSSRDLAAELKSIASKLDLPADSELAQEIETARSKLEASAEQAANWAKWIGDAVVAAAMKTVEAGEAAARKAIQAGEAMLSGVVKLGGKIWRVVKGPEEEAEEPPPLRDETEDPESAPKRRKTKAAPEVIDVKLDLSDAQRSAREVLAKMARHIEDRLSALPDFTRKADHVAEADALKDKLIQAENLGDLAARYRTLVKISNTRAEKERGLDLEKSLSKDKVRETFDVLIGGMARNQQLRELLLSIARFALQADTLTSDFAPRLGTPLAVAPVLAEISRAAKRVCGQRCADRNYRDCIGALAEAIDAIDKLGYRADQELLEVRHEMFGLMEKFEVMHSRALEVKASDIDASKMLKLLEQRKHELMADELDTRGAAESGPVDDEVIPATMDEDRTDAMIREHFEDLVRPIYQNADESADEPSFTTLKVVELDMSPSPTQSKGDKKEVEAEVSAEVKILQKQARQAASAFQRRAKRALAGLEETRATAAEILRDIHRAVGSQVVERWANEIEGACEALEKISSRGGESYRNVAIDVERAKSVMKSAEEVLRDLEDVPPKVCEGLHAVLSEARRLESQFSARGFDEVAFRWATAVLPRLRETLETLKLTQEAMEAGKKGRTNTRMLNELNELVTSVCKGSDRLGAWSRFAILAGIHRRISTCESVLPKAAKGTIDEILSQAQRRAAELEPIAGGAAGERLIADMCEGFVDLGEALADDRDVDDGAIERLQDLSEIVWRIAGPPQGDQWMTDCEAALKLLEGFTSAKSKRTREAANQTGLAIRSLRSLLMTRQLEAREEAFRLASSRYVKGVGEARSALSTARDRILRYDPFAESVPVATIADEVISAVTRASESMTGPALALFSTELLALAEGLRRDRETKGDVFQAEATRILNHIDEMVEAAGKLVDSDAFDRLAKLHAITSGRIENEKEGGTRRPFIEWMDRVTRDLGALYRIERPEAMLEALAKIESGPFRDFLPKPEKESPQATAETMTVESVGEGGGPGRSRGAPFATLPIVLEPVFQTTRGGLGAGGSAGVLDRGRTWLSRPGSMAAPTVDLEDSPRGVGGSRGQLPPRQVTAPFVDSTSEGRDVDEVGLRDYGKDDLDFEDRPDLDPGHMTERSDAIRMRTLSPELFRKIDDKLMKAAKKISEALGPDGVPELNNFEKLVAQHKDKVRKLVELFRKYRGTEIVLVIDQSGSTEGAINEKLRLLVALIMAAVMESEANCSVVGFGDETVGDTPVAEEALAAAGVPEAHRAFLQRKGIKIFVHKPMQSRLNSKVGEAVFLTLGNADGNTDLVAPMDVGYGQFTKRENDKLMLLFTDAYVTNPTDVAGKIQTARQSEFMTIMFGVGKAQHIKAAGGEWGIEVKDIDKLVDQCIEMMEKAYIRNTGKAKGTVDSAASGGAGVPASQARLAAARMEGSEQVPRLGTTRAPAKDSQQMMQTRGKRRELPSLADRAHYERELHALEDDQRASTNSREFRQSLQEVAELEEAQRRAGLIETIRDGIAQALPHAAGSGWDRKQLSGSLLDEDQIPLFIISSRQGIPILRIYKRRRPFGERRTKVVLEFDGSPSVDPETADLLAQLFFAVGDAIIDADSEAQIAATIFDSRVRLLKGFEQGWNARTKAHIWSRMRRTGRLPATDDERSRAESDAMLRMLQAEVGASMSFTDGMGMPGLGDMLRQTTANGFAALVFGVGSECKSVVNFGAHACYGRNIVQAAKQVGPSLSRAFELTGRVG